jgi:mono/diheme cytochrome c family protein
MKRRSAGVIALFLPAIIRTGFAGDAAPQVPKEPEAGVYTSAQAEKGEQTYGAVCSGCHMAELTGYDRAPPLAGDSFVSRWQGSTLNDLFQRIKGTMPQTAPGSLSDKAYVEIVAFLLEANGYQSGAKELQVDPAALKSIPFSSLR